MANVHRSDNRCIVRG